MLYKFWVYPNIVSRKSIPDLPLQFNFYLPDQKLPGLETKMRILYFYNSIGSNKEASVSNDHITNRIGWQPIPDPTVAKQVGSIYACPKFASPYNLYPFQIYQTESTVTIIKLDSNEYSLEGNDIFWAWLQPTTLKLYPLGAIIWSPAQEVATNIVDILMNQYRVVNVTKFKVPNRTLVQFVKKVYLDDRRCDMSQLSGKCRHMYSHAPKYRFIKFLVPTARLDSNRVSQTSVDLKYMIRKRFKRLIPNYVHDIIIHISDNAGHTRNMERYVNQESRLGFNRSVAS